MGARPPDRTHPRPARLDDGRVGRVGEQLTAATIDFHTHYLPLAASHFEGAGCPRLVVESDTCAHMYRGERRYRTIDDRTWDMARRIADMDARGVGLQVISPIPVCYSYDAAVSEATAYARLQNDAIAGVVRARSDRFAGLGMVPLQDPDAACAEVRRAMTELALAGVEIGTTAGGRELDDPALEAFWAECAASNAIVFIHPENVPGGERLQFMQMVISTAYVSETGIASARLLMKGIFTRYPTLRIVLAHAGGTLPWLLPRLDRVWSIDPTIQAALPKKPSEIARAFYGDTITFDADNLALVAKRLGTEKLLVGSDYPFAIMEVTPGSVVDDVTSFDDATKAALRYGNARRLLGGSATHV